MPAGMQLPGSMGGYQMPSDPSEGWDWQSTNGPAATSGGSAASAGAGSPAADEGYGIGGFEGRQTDPNWSGSPGLGEPPSGSTGGNMSLPGSGGSSKDYGGRESSINAPQNPQFPGIMGGGSFMGSTGPGPFQQSGANMKGAPGGRGGFGGQFTGGGSGNSAFGQAGGYGSPPLPGGGSRDYWGRGSSTNAPYNPQFPGVMGGGSFMGSTGPGPFQQSGANMKGFGGRRGTGQPPSANMPFPPGIPQPSAGRGMPYFGGRGPGGGAVRVGR